MSELDPFENIDPDRMKAIFKKHRSHLDWSDIIFEYQNWTPPFDKKIFDAVQPYDFVQLLYKNFHFTQNRAHLMKTEFLKWLESDWDFFASDHPEKVLANIEEQLSRWNEENPLYQRSKINWIPLFGGVLKPPVYDPLQEEKQEMIDLGLKYPATDEDVTFLKK
jgi:hypothetical protein